VEELTEHVLHVHDVTFFTNLHFCSLHREDNLHLETHFQKFAFAGPEKHRCRVNERPKCIKCI